jgi:tetratricopeptide (TPR) repeat protein
MTRTAKRAVFWAVTLILPVGLLTVAECLLRATGVFAPEPLFLELPDSQGAFLKFNPWVTRRYFDSTSAALPNLAPETFPRAKPTSTFRILCLGESTTEGFPFEGSVPFPVQLREILTHAYPRRRIEVLNSGISAISSYVVLDLLPELLEGTRPDLVVVYLGHNEFYGIYGSGSTLFPAKKRAMVTLMLRLQHMHLVQGLKRAIAAFKPIRAPTPGSRSLMQAVIGDQDIAFGSEEYRTTLEAFRVNLEAIADRCQDRGVPVVVGSLISNYRDQPPFHSLAMLSGDSAIARAIRSSLQIGDSLLAEGQASAAEAAFQEAWRSDTSNADAWFGLGRSRLAQHDSIGALRWFVGAKDRDAMRFRASEEANDIIAATAAARGLGFVDLVQVLRSESPGGIIGNDLLCDHLHPNPQGYYLMAAAFYKGVIARGILPAPDEKFVLPLSPYGVTDLDWEIGLLKIFPMLHEWPFKPVGIKPGEYRSHGDTAATRIALQYHRAGFAWVRAHDMLAHIYTERGDLERARQEYRAVAVYHPDDPWPYNQIARLYEAEENWLLRSAALQEELVRSPIKGMIAYQLAISEWKQGHLARAIQGMEFASGAPDLKVEEQMNAQFYLAGFLFDAGRRIDAIKVLRTILAEQPSFVPAQEFLSRLERSTP